MKKLYHLLLALFILGTCMSFMACQKEESIEPVQPDTRNASLNASILLTNKLYLLSKLNNVSFEYAPSKALTKVSYNPDKYVTYETGLGEESDPAEEQSPRKKNTTYARGKRIKEIKFPLNDGVLNESYTRYFDPGTGAVINSVTHGYEFDYNGRLKKRYVKNNPVNRIEFIYQTVGGENNGDLQKVIEYTPTGALKQTTEFIYSDKAPADKYGFYPEISDIDPFDRCLGTLSRKLPTAIKIDYANPYLADVSLYYEYELDAHGYPVSRKTYKHTLLNKELIATALYKYQ